MLFPIHNASENKIKLQLLKDINEINLFEWASLFEIYIIYMGAGIFVQPIYTVPHVIKMQALSSIYKRTEANAVNLHTLKPKH